MSTNENADPLTVGVSTGQTSPSCEMTMIPDSSDKYHLNPAPFAAENHIPSRVYAYLEADGKSIGAVARFEKGILNLVKKEFRQWRYEPDAPKANALGYTLGLTRDDRGKVAQPLWRLPEIINALRTNAEQTVYFAEGEKVVDALVARGLVATTLAGGTASSKREDLDDVLAPLTDAKVVVLCDCDTPGREHAQRIATALHGDAASVKLIDIAPDRSDGYDIGDWLEKGHATHELDTLVKDAPEWVPSGAEEPYPKMIGELVKNYPSLRKPVIEGLLREGETMNVIAAPKVGKSWLVLDLALSIATGRPWLGMSCVPGEVLIIDNELHAETMANRIPKVAAARGIGMAEVGDRLYVDNLRGRLKDLFALGPYFKRFEPGRFKVVILDAFYRFLPMQADENDNGTMANLYNCLDAFADYLKCSFVLIHHSSKGNQSLKDVTDVGAGAGAQSRATDTHLILRRHQTDGAVVLEATVRSWSPLSPRCLRWDYPVWTPATDLDPAALRKEGVRRSAPKVEKEPTTTYDAASFTKRFLIAEPKSQARIQEETDAESLSSRRVKQLLELAEEDGLAFRWKLDNKRIGYATRPQPEATSDETDATPSKRQVAEELLKANPKLSNREAAKRSGASLRYIRGIRSKMDGQDNAK